MLIGVAVPWAAIMLERTRWFSASRHHEPLDAVAIGLPVPARWFDDERETPAWHGRRPPGPHPVTRWRRRARQRT